MGAGFETWEIRTSATRSTTSEGNCLPKSACCSSAPTTSTNTRGASSRSSGVASCSRGTSPRSIAHNASSYFRSATSCCTEGPQAGSIVASRVTPQPIRMPFIPGRYHEARQFVPGRERLTPWTDLGHQSLRSPCLLRALQRRLRPRIRWWSNRSHRRPRDRTTVRSILHGSPEAIMFRRRVAARSLGGILEVPPEQLDPRTAFARMVHFYEFERAHGAQPIEQDGLVTGKSSKHLAPRAACSRLGSC
jgi:hypothetical protein